MARTLAYISYARRDDRASGGLISSIAWEIERQVTARIDAEIGTFQHIDKFDSTSDWQESIYGALGEATVLIAIVSPSFFNSKHCRAELSYFVHRTMLNEQNAFVVPVVLVETPVLYDTDSTRRR